MNNRRRIVTGTLLTLAAVLLLASLRQPLWQMRMEAPQYQDEEALDVVVFANKFHGHLAELKTLNQYIGVHVPATLPQFKWLPAALIAGAFAPIVLALLFPGSRIAVLLSPVVLTLALAAAAFQATQQMHDIGHNRDKKTVMAGVKDFTPPFLGRSRIAQFDIASRFGSGAFLIMAALALQASAAAFSRQRTSISKPRENLALGATLTGASA